MSVPRTDAEIIDETNALARYLCGELIGTGYQVPDDHKFYEAEDPRSKRVWAHAVKIMEMTTKTEMADVLATLDEEPVLRTYGVRLHATMRAECSTEVEATSFAEAVEKAKALNHDDFNYSIDDTIEGDETMMIYGPADDDPDDDDKWGGEGVDIDKRKAGEPFSWEACQLVKDLAALAAITNESFHRDKIKGLIDRAKALCAKEDSDDANVSAA